MGALSKKWIYLKETKNAIRNAITSRGVMISDTDTFRSYADKILSIRGDLKNITNWQYFDYANGRNELALSLVPADTANGVIFTGMFRYSDELTYLPEFDTSSGQAFDSFCFGCTGLLNVPDYDYSNATTLNHAYYNCTGIKELNINAPKCVDYMGTFRGCSALETLGIDMSLAEKTTNMLLGCLSLVSFKVNGKISADLNLSDCINLSRDSVESIIAALSETAEGKTLAISENTRALYTDKEWTELIAQKSNWSFEVK